MDNVIPLGSLLTSWENPVGSYLKILSKWTKYQCLKGKENHRVLGKKPQFYRNSFVLIAWVGILHVMLES